MVKNADSKMSSNEKCGTPGHMEIFTLLTPCSVQGCMQGGNNLVNTMELQCFPPCYRVVNTLYHL